MIAAFFWLELTAVAAPQGCDAGVDRARLDTVLTEAEAASASRDATALSSSAEEARKLATCVDTLLPAPQIARLYRLSGVARFTSGDQAGAFDAFSVARALDPAFELDPSLDPPLRQLYGAAPTKGERAAVGPPSEGWAAIDGRPAEEAPTSRGYFAQWFWPDGTVRQNYLVQSGGAPPYPHADRRERPPSHRNRGQLAVTGTAFAVIGAGGLALGGLSSDPNLGRAVMGGGASLGATGAFLLGLAAAR